MIQLFKEWKCKRKDHKWGEWFYDDIFYHRQCNRCKSFFSDTGDEYARMRLGYYLHKHNEFGVFKQYLNRGWNPIQELSVQKDEIKYL